jgi:hypothetical protein
MAEVLIEEGSMIEAAREEEQARRLSRQVKSPFR